MFRRLQDAVGETSRRATSLLGSPTADGPASPEGSPSDGATTQSATTQSDTTQSGITAGPQRGGRLRPNETELGESIFTLSSSLPAIPSSAGRPDSAEVEMDFAAYEPSPQAMSPQAMSPTVTQEPYASTPTTATAQNNLREQQWTERDLMQENRALLQERNALDVLVRELTPLEGVADLDSFAIYLRNLHLQKATSMQELKKMTELAEKQKSQMRQMMQAMENLKEEQRMEMATKSELFMVLQKQVEEKEEEIHRLKTVVARAQSVTPTPGSKLLPPPMTSPTSTIVSEAITTPISPGPPSIPNEQLEQKVRELAATSRKYADRLQKMMAKAKQLHQENQRLKVEISRSAQGSPDSPLNAYYSQPSASVGEEGSATELSKESIAEGSQGDLPVESAGTGAQDLQDLRSKNADLQKQLDQAQAVHAQLTTKVTELTTQNDTLRTSIDGLQRQLAGNSTTANRSADSTSTTLKQAEALLIRERQNSERIRNTLQAKEQELVELQSAWDTTQQAMNQQLRESSTRWEQERQSLVNAHDMEMQQLRDEMGASASLREQIVVLQGENTELQKQLAALEQSLVSQSQEAATRESHSNQRCQELEEQLAARSRDLATAQTAFQESKATLKAKIQEILARKEQDKQALVTDHTTQIQRLREELDKNEEKSEQQIVQYRKQLEATVQQKEELQRELQGAQESLKLEQNKLVELEENRKTETLEYTERREKLEQRLVELQSAMEEKVALERALAAKEEQLRADREQLSASEKRFLEEVDQRKMLEQQLADLQQSWNEKEAEWKKTLADAEKSIHAEQEKRSTLERSYQNESAQTETLQQQYQHLQASLQSLAAEKERLEKSLAAMEEDLRVQREKAVAGEESNSKHIAELTEVRRRLEEQLVALQQAAVDQEILENQVAEKTSMLEALRQELTIVVGNRDTAITRLEETEQRLQEQIAIVEQAVREKQALEADVRVRDDASRAEREQLATLRQESSQFAQIRQDLDQKLTESTRDREETAARMQAQLGQLQTELEHKESELQSLRSSWTAQEQELSSKLQLAADQLARTEQTHSEERARLQQQIAESSSSADQQTLLLRQQLEDAEKEKRSLQDAIAMAEEDLRSEREKLILQESSKTDEITQVVTAKQQLEQKLAANAKEFAELRGSYERMSSEYKSKLEKLTAAKDQEKQNLIMENAVELERFRKTQSSFKAKEDTLSAKLKEAVERLQQQRRTQEEEVKRLREEQHQAITSLQAELATLKEQMLTKEQEAVELKASAAEMVEKVKQEREAIAMLENSKNDAIAQLEAQKAELEEHVASKSKQAEELQALLDEASAQRREAAERLESRDHEFHSMVEDHAKQLKQLQDEMDRVVADSEQQSLSVRNELATMMAERDTLLQAVATAEESANAERQKLATLESNYGQESLQFQEERHRWEEQLAGSQKERDMALTEAQEQVNSAHVELAAKIQEIVRLESAWKSQEKDMQSRLRSLSERLEQQQRVHSEELQRMQRRVEEAGLSVEQQVSSLQEQLDIAVKEKLALEAIVSAAEASLQAEKEKLTALEASKAELLRLQQDKATLDEQVSVKTEELKNAQTSFQEAHAASETKTREILARKEQEKKAMIAEHTAEMDVLKKQLEAANAEIQHHVALMTEQLDSVRTQKEEAMQKLADAERALTERHEKIAALESMNNETVSKLAAAQKDLENQLELRQQELVTLRASFAEAETLFKQKETELEQRGLQEREELTDVHSVQMERLRQDHERTATSIHQEIATLREQLAAMETEKGTVQRALSEAEATLRSEQESLVALEARRTLEVTQFLERQNQLEGELEAARKEHSEAIAKQLELQSLSQQQQQQADAEAGAVRAEAIRIAQELQNAKALVEEWTSKYTLEKEHHAALTSELEQSQQQAVMLQQKLDELHSRESDQSQEILRLREQVDQERQKQTQLEDKVSQAEKRMETVEAERAQQLARSQELSERIEASTLQIAALQEEKELLANNLKKREKAVSNLQKELASLREVQAMLETQLQESKAGEDSVKGELDKILRQLSERDAELQKEKARQKKQLNEFEKVRAETASRAEQYESAAASAQKELAILRKKNAELNTQLEDKEQAFERHIVGSQQDASQKEEELRKALEKQKKIAADRLAALEEEKKIAVQEREATIMALRKDLKGAGEQREELLASLEQHQITEQALNERMQTLVLQIEHREKELQQQLLSASEHVSAMEKERVELQRRLQKDEETIAWLQGDLAAASERVAALDTDLEASRNEESVLKERLVLTEQQLVQREAALVEQKQSALERIFALEEEKEVAQKRVEELQKEMVALQIEVTTVKEQYAGEWEAHKSTEVSSKAQMEVLQQELKERIRLGERAEQEKSDAVAQMVLQQATLIQLQADLVLAKEKAAAIEREEDVKRQEAIRKLQEQLETLKQQLAERETEVRIAKESQEAAAALAESVHAQLKEAQIMAMQKEEQLSALAEEMTKAEEAMKRNLLEWSDKERILLEAQQVLEVKRQELDAAHSNQVETLQKKVQQLKSDLVKQLTEGSHKESVLQQALDSAREEMEEVRSRAKEAEEKLRVLQEELNAVRGNENESAARVVTMEQGWSEDKEKLDKTITLLRASKKQILKLQQDSQNAVAESNEAKEKFVAVQGDLASKDAVIKELEDRIQGLDDNANAASSDNEKLVTELRTTITNLEQSLTLKEKDLEATQTDLLKQRSRFEEREREAQEFQSRYESQVLELSQAVERHQMLMMKVEILEQELDTSKRLFEQRTLDCDDLRTRLSAAEERLDESTVASRVQISDLLANYQKAQHESRTYGEVAKQLEENLEGMEAQLKAYEDERRLLEAEMDRKEAEANELRKNLLELERALAEKQEEVSNRRSTGQKEKRSTDETERDELEIVIKELQEQLAERQTQLDVIKEDTKTRERNLRNLNQTLQDEIRKLQRDKVVTPIPSLSVHQQQGPPSPTIDEVNMLYLRHVIYRYMADPSRRAQLNPVLSAIFQFTPEEEAKIASARPGFFRSI